MKSEFMSNFENANFILNPTFDENIFQILGEFFCAISQKKILKMYKFLK